MSPLRRKGEKDKTPINRRMLSSFTFSCTLEPDDWDDNSASPSESITRQECWVERRELLEVAEEIPSQSTRRALRQERRKMLGLEDEMPTYLRCLEAIIAGGVSPDYKMYGTPLPEILKKYPLWSEVSWATRPEGGGIPPKRRDRKAHQVENMVVPTRAIIENALATEPQEKRLRVVEFCAGSGFVLLPLAQLYPQVDFVLIDYKAKSIQIAKERISAASLESNVQVIEGRIQDYGQNFDVGIALHACGALSDIVLDMCLKSRASFVVCPCCIGKISFMHHLPRSKTVLAALSSSSLSSSSSSSSSAHWKSLLKAADFGHAEQKWYTPRNRDRRVCKSIVEEDRRLHCEERGFHTELLIMTPTSASPKNDILVGWPRKGQGQERGEGEREPLPLTPFNSPFTEELELVQAVEPSEKLVDFLWRQMFDPEQRQAQQKQTGSSQRLS